MFIFCVNNYRGIWALYFPWVNGDRTGNVMKGQRRYRVFFRFSSNMKLETEGLHTACLNIKIVHPFPSSFHVCMCQHTTGNIWRTHRTTCWLRSFSRSVLEMGKPKCCAAYPWRVLMLFLTLLLSPTSCTGLTVTCWAPPSWTWRRCCRTGTGTVGNVTFCLDETIS